jgi:branched-chain amino acid aminotransferase
MKAIANVDGEISPAESAKISVLDRGFLYGDSIYEVFRTYSGVPFLYEEHMTRLANSARLAYMQVSQSDDFLLAEMKKTVAAGNAKRGEEIYVRLTLTRGTGPIDLNPTRDFKTSYVILAKDIPKWEPRLFAEGVRLAIPEIRRNPTRALDPNIKGGNYLNNVLAVGEAVRGGADDALICNMDGLLSECSNSNILFVIDGKLVTPDLASGNLNGTTKNLVGRLAREAGIDFQHAPLRVEDIREASEAFIASATREIMPVASIRLPDGRSLTYPSGGGQTTSRLIELYAAFVKDYVARLGNTALF